MSDFLKDASRSSGDWLPGVKKCSRRVQPCGNAYCADEAMRSLSIRDSNPHASIYALSHSEKIARDCNEAGVDCPLGPFSGIIAILRNLAGR